MATKQIAWNSGSGNIILDYTGSRDDTVTVSSDENDLYVQRSQVLTVATTDKKISREVTVTQGMREPNLIDSDEKWLIDSNDTYLIV